MREIIDPRPVGTKRLMMLTPDYLTSNPSEECPQADYALFNHDHKAPHYPLQVGTSSFEGVRSLWLPFPGKAIKLSFLFTQNSESRNYFGVGVQRLDSVSPGDTTVPLQRATNWDLLRRISWGDEKREMKVECKAWEKWGHISTYQLGKSFEASIFSSLKWGYISNWGFELQRLEKTLESSLDSKEIKPVNPKGNQPWTFIGSWSWSSSTWWSPDVKSWLTGKDPDAGKDGRQKEKRVAEDEMIGWHHCLSGHKLGQTLANSERHREAWCAAVHGTAKSQTWLSYQTTFPLIGYPLKTDNMSNMEIYSTICKIDSQRELAVWLRELKQGLCNKLKGGMGREMGGRFGREGTWVYRWLILVDVWWKTTKFCKAIIL